MTIWFLMGNHQQLIFFLRKTEEQNLYQTKLQLKNKKGLSDISVLESYWLFGLVLTCLSQFARECTECTEPKH